jgi:hypothetical protein
MKTSGNIKFSFDLDFEGIVILLTSTEPDFRLVWAMEKVLGIPFRQVDETIYSLKGRNEQLVFSRFEYETGEEDTIIWRLHSNRCPHGFLATEFKNFDYILVVFGDFPPTFGDEITRKLRTIRFITSAFRISAETIKTKELLLM